MSIFTGDFNPDSWLQEKTLRALQAAVCLVDIANEPDTTDWYKRNLVRTAEQIVARLAPVVALLYGVESSAAAERDEWGPMLEGGSFALATWCRKWKIADPHQIGKGSIRHLRTVDEDEEKAEELAAESFDGDFEQAMDLKLQIYSYMSRRLVHDGLTPEAKQLMLWLMGSLWLSDPPDVVSVSKRFLPTDIGVTPQEAGAAYEELFQRGLIERVDRVGRDRRPDHLSLRLVVRGLNDSRHAPDYKEEQFGYPGARVAGKVTSGQGMFITLPETFSAMLDRWFKEERQLTELRDFLQSRMGDDSVYVESAEVKFLKQKTALFVSFRYPLDAELEPLEMELSGLAENWFKERVSISHSGSVDEPGEN